MPSPFRSAWFRFWFLQFIRASLSCIFAVIVFSIWDIGLDLRLSLLAIGVGVISGGIFLVRSSSFLKCVGIHALGFLALGSTLSLLNSINAGNLSDPRSDFYYYLLEQKILTGSALYLISIIATWLYWTISSFVIVETVAVAGILILLLAGHRNYNLEVPKTISQFAWENSWPVDAIIVLISGAVATLLVIYLVLSNYRPTTSKNQVKLVRGKRIFALTAITAILAGALLSALSLVVWEKYQINIAKASEGVGMENKEGESPLSFQSAVGKTKQPAALVRLENNYSDNPWSPMLYLRESALSLFKAGELVRSDPRFDQDVPPLFPGAVYNGPSRPTGPFRNKLAQSIYLLTKHSSLFAVDFPQEIRTLKNPDPQRFIAAYQALSYAPITSRQDLLGLEVKDPAWDKETLEHYLRAPGSLTSDLPTNTLQDATMPILDEHQEDLRYKLLANEITKATVDPMAKALLIVDYLSQNSIYTRAPGHQVTKGGDPIAPYLFTPEKRGYCVHFAHAAVFLMRLVGIPSRIATGYLTDLKYAKDGHVLLHLGDRHAWPEIFIYGHGWIVVDVTPARAENEQVLVPDENLLQELMSKLSPAEISTAEVTTSTSSISYSADSILDALKQIKQMLLYGILTLFLAFLSLKTWLRYSYLMGGNCDLRSLRVYRATFAELADLGLYRIPGETHREYASRQEPMFAASLLRMEPLLHRQIYSTGFITEAELKSLLEHRDLIRRNLGQSFPRWKRVLAFFNPRSLLSYSRW